jgi:putative peptidoglycan lipid II flippase
MSTPTTTPGSDNRQIARAAGTVMVAIILSQLTGLLAKSLTGRAFGTGAEIDAFFAANRLSETLFLLVAGGALGSSFIPVFTSFLIKDDRSSAWQLASSIANLVTLVMVAFSILAAIFAPPIVRYLLAPGFPAEQQALTVTLLRILLPASIIFGLSGLTMGVLNAHQKFLFPALAPSMYQVGWIFGVLALAPIWGIFGLAWGALIGAALHFIVQIPGLLRLPQLKYAPSLGLHLAAVRDVARLMGPRLLGVAVVQLNFWLNTLLASMQPEGSLTGINLAFPLMIMPQAAIAQSIAIAALPTFSAQVARGQRGEMRSSLAATLRGVLFLAAPASVGLILLRRPIVAMIYQGGEFSANSTELVAWALLWYASGLIGHSLVEIVSRAFYALHDTKTPVAVGVAAMSLNLVFSLLFAAWFRRIGWAPHGGLALANSLATALEMVLLLVFMRRRLEGLEGQQLLNGAILAGLGTLVMGAALWAWLGFSAGQSFAVITLGGVLLGGICYTLSLWLLRVREIHQVWDILRSKLSRI